MFRLALRLERRVQGVHQRLMEHHLGVETLKVDDLLELGPECTELARYVATPILASRATLKRLQPGAGDMFVDIGSGKGQAVIVAVQLGFGRVIGVELAASLTVTATRNLHRLADAGRLDPARVRLLCADAARWPIPPDLSVIYMYSPFVGQTFARFVERVFASYDEHPRPLVLVYGFPFEHNWLIETGRVRTIDVNPASWPRRPLWWESVHTFVTYQVTAPDGSAPPRTVASGGLGWRQGMDRWSRRNGSSFLMGSAGGLPPVSSDRASLWAQGNAAPAPSLPSR